MRVLVTGSTSYVGSFVLPALAKDHELVLFVRQPIESEFEIVVGDIVDPEACRNAVEKVDAVVHLAAEQSDEDRIAVINIEGTYQLAKAAADAGAHRFVMASTSCVYGHCFPDTPFEFTPTALPINEDQACDPHRTYGYSKLAAETALRYIARSQSLQASALRLNWVWAEKEVEWWVDEQQRNLARMAHNFWAYAEGRDVGIAFRQAIEANEMPTFDTYNICAGDTIADETSAELVARFHPGLAPLAEGLESNESLFSWQKAHDAFGYRPEHTWREFL